jgi:hypothetical protein
LEEMVVQGLAPILQAQEFFMLVEAGVVYTYPALRVLDQQVGVMLALLGVMELQTQVVEAVVVMLAVLVATVVQA